MYTKNICIITFLFQDNIVQIQNNSKRTFTPKRSTLNKYKC